MKFTERRNGFTLEGIDGRRDIKFSNLAGAHFNSPYDDPNKPPQHAITIWVDDPEIAEALKANDFLVGQAEDNYHKGEDNLPLGMRFFIKFVAYPKMKMNPRTGKVEPTPKVVIKSSMRTEQQDLDGFENVDKSFISSMDISFRQFKYDPKRPCVAAINELWCELDPTANGRDDFDDDYLEQKWADVPLSDDGEVPFK